MSRQVKVMVGGVVALLSIFSTLSGVGAAYGSLTARVAVAEQFMQDRKYVPAALAKLTNSVENIEEDVSETRADVKQLLKEARQGMYSRKDGAHP